MELTSRMQAAERRPPVAFVRSLRRFFPRVPRNDSHANLYSGNATPPLPFVGEEEEEEDGDDEPFEGTNFESVIAPFCAPVSHPP